MAERSGGYRLKSTLAALALLLLATPSTAHAMAGSSARKGRHPEDNAKQVDSGFVSKASLPQSVRSRSAKDERERIGRTPYRPVHHEDTWQEAKEERQARPRSSRTAAGTYRGVRKSSSLSAESTTSSRQFLPGQDLLNRHRQVDFGAVVTSSGECNVNVSINKTDAFDTQLAKYLNSTSVQLIFFYVDLLDVTGEIFSEGDCESENSARTRTPLVWAFVPAGSSYARSYLTMPVNAPRVYSLGLLDQQVKHLWSPHLQVIVNDEQANCWHNLPDSDKIKILLNTVRDLHTTVVTSKHVNQSKYWEICYSRPTTKGYHVLPDTLSLLLPAAPLYFCEDGPGGNVRVIERHGFMKAVYYLFLLLGIASVPVQFHMNFYFLRLVRRYGIKPRDPWFTDQSKLVIPRHITSAELPWHMSAAGLMSHRTWFGKRAFHRLKKAFSMLLIALAYVAWPFYLVFDLLSPHKIPPEEAIFNCQYRTLALIALAGGIFFVILLWFSFPSDHKSMIQKDVEVNNVTAGHSAAQMDHPENDTQHFGDDVLKVTATLMRSFTAVCFTPTIILKYMATFPGEANNSGDSRNTCSNIGRYLLGIPAVMLGVVVAVFQETVVQICTCLVFLSLLSIQGLGSLVRNVSCNMTRACSCALYLSFLLLFTVFELAVIAATFLVLYIAFQEFLCICSITLGAILINYPSQTVVVVGWIVAVATEIRTTYHGYRLPMLAAQERYSIFMNKILGHRFVLSFDEDPLSKYCPKKNGNVEIEKWTKSPQNGEHVDHHTAVPLDNTTNPPGTLWVYWKQFFTEGYKDSINFVCLALLKGGHGVMSRLQTKVKIPWSQNEFHIRQRAPPLGNHKLKDDIYDRINYFEKGKIMTWLYDKRNTMVSKEAKKDIEPRNLMDLRLQYTLRVRFFNTMAKLLGVFVFQAALVSLLLSFHALWQQSTDINILVVESAILPVLSYARARSNQTSVDPLTEQRIKWMMKKCVVNAEKNATYSLDKCKEKEAVDRQQHSSHMTDRGRRPTHVQRKLSAATDGEVKSGGSTGRLGPTTETDHGHKRAVAATERTPLLGAVPESAFDDSDSDQLTEVSDYELESDSEFFWEDDTF